MFIYYVKMMGLTEQIFAAVAYFYWITVILIYFTYRNLPPIHDILVVDDKTLSVSKEF